MSKNNETIFQKLRSTIILLIVLAVVSGLLYVMYRIFMAIKEGIQEAMSSHNINISKTAANIGVQSRSQQSVVDSAQRYVYRAWENSQPPEDAKPSGYANGRTANAMCTKARVLRQRIQDGSVNAAPATAAN